MRKTYESEGDLKRECSVVDNIMRVFGKGWTAEKLGKYDSLDSKIRYNGKLKLLLEVKTCNLSDCRMNGNGGWGVAKKKWTYGRAMSKEEGVPFWFAVRFKDKDMVVDASTLKENQVRFAIGGRNDRADSYDIEPMVYIPLKFFKDIK